jgi:hypothetical protein
MKPGADIKMFTFLKKRWEADLKVLKLMVLKKKEKE